MTVPRCECGGQMVTGYGLAAGGMGEYLICHRCSAIVSTTQECGCGACVPTDRAIFCEQCGFVTCDADCAAEHLRRSPTCKTVTGTNSQKTDEA
jgi:hypothetical protein